MTVTCAHCGKSFTAHRQKRRWERFCAIACANKSRALPPDQRFWKSVQKTDRCWIWKGTIIKDGYGRLFVSESIKPRYMPAHRYSWQLHNGAIPDGMQVLHHCDNPPCVRPDHLFIGTTMDNVADCIAKGRRPKRPRAKLTVDAVREIRTTRKSGKELARKYGVSVSRIYTIRSDRSTWEEVA